MKPLAGLTLLLAALPALAACGRVGPPRAPGPASAIIYPRPYPAVPLPGTMPAAAMPAETPAPGPAPAEAEQGTLPVVRPGSPL